MSYDVLGSDVTTCSSSQQTIESKIHKKDLKHDDASIMVWGCLNASGADLIVKSEGIMNGEMYRDILRSNLSEYSLPRPKTAR